MSIYFWCSLLVYFPILISFLYLFVFFNQVRRGGQCITPFHSQFVCKNLRSLFQVSFLSAVVGPNVAQAAAQAAVSALPKVEITDGFRVNDEKLRSVADGAKEEGITCY